MSLAVFLWVGDEVLGDIVICSGLNRVVKLPQILQAGRVVDDLPGGRLASFARPVIHDGDTRMQCVYQGARIRLIETMVRREIKVYWADAVHRAGKRDFLSFG